MSTGYFVYRLTDSLDPPFPLPFFFLPFRALLDRQVSKAVSPYPKKLVWEEIKTHEGCE